MIIVWGSVDAAPEDMDALKKVSLEHVHRSRKEPGCISHSVQADLEDPNRLIFFEEWEDMAALQTHFQVAESSTFIEEVSGLAASPPAIRIFESEQVG